jgi:multiple sugar transport system ATP-binding protein
MNLLPGNLVSAEAGHALVEVAGQRVTVAVDARHLAAGAAVQIGVRPEHVPVADQGQGTGLAATLLHMERLGDSSLLYVSVGAGLPTFTFKVEGSATQPVGQQLTLRLLPDQLHLFDAQGQACRRSVELPT